LRGAPSRTGGAVSTSAASSCAAPRALKSNTHDHVRRFTVLGAHLTLGILRGQIIHARQRAATASDRMALAGFTLSRHRRQAFSALGARLASSLRANADMHRARLAGERERVHRLSERGRRAFLTLVERGGARVERCGRLLGALSYRAVLARGFALVRDAGGQPLFAAAAIKPDDLLDIEFADGRVGARALPTSEAGAPDASAPARSSPTRRSPRKRDGQGSLF
jgi:exodeoxyribonuclease VII large subunit